MIAYKLSEKYGFGTLVLDPYGAELLFILDIAERDLGKEAREEIWKFLEPYHKMRALQVLQAEGIRQRFWLVAPAVGAEPVQSDEEDFDFSTSNDERTDVEKSREVNNFEDEDFEEEEKEDDDLLF